MGAQMETARIINALRESGKKRFNELQRLVKGISPRVLSNELKELEMNGFVKRIVHAQSPVLVEYELTAYSDTLKDVLVFFNSMGNRSQGGRVRESCMLRL